MHNDLSRVDIQPIWSYTRYKRHVSSKRDRSGKQLTGRSNLFVHEQSKILHYYLLIQSILDAYLSLVLRATLGITTLLSREARSGSRLAQSNFLCTMKCWMKRRWNPRFRRHIICDKILFKVSHVLYRARQETLKVKIYTHNI